MRRFFRIAVLFFLNIFIIFSAKSQNELTITNSDTVYEEDVEAHILKMWNGLQSSWYAKIAKYQTNVQISLPDVVEDSMSVDSMNIIRLQNLLNSTVFPMVYNDDIRRYIDLYTRELKSMPLILARAQIYFPMFEEILDKYNVPLELKYLAVIESALRPDAVSMAGATGLWQFMLGTGKIYGLNVSTYVDERMDPLKATDAAARHLYDLSEMFEGNWPLALAAYNCGAGNVVKAIKRSGGVMDFWKIYKYLPRETRGYVPAFYAAMFAMNYYELYGHVPAKVNIEAVDTVMVYKKMDFKKISSVTNIPVEELKYYNPQYKRSVIPTTSEGLVLCLPAKYIMSFENSKDSILKLQDMEDVANIEVHTPDGSNQYGDFYYKNKYHVVKSGESYSIISRKYGVSVDKLMKINHAKSGIIHPGQKLIIGQTKVYTSKPKPVELKADTVRSDSLKSIDSAAVRFQLKQTDSLRTSNGI